MAIEQKSALHGLTTTQRIAVVALAEQKLTPIKKLVLRIVKLALLSPIFFIIAKIDGWQMMPYLLLAGIGYPLLTHPLTRYVVREHLEAARKDLMAE